MKRSARESDLAQRVGFGLCLGCVVLIVSGLWFVALNAVEAELGLPAWGSGALQLLLCVGAILLTRGTQRVLFGVCVLICTVDLGVDLVRWHQDKPKVEAGLGELARMIGENQCRDIPGRELKLRVCVWREP